MALTFSRTTHATMTTTTTTTTFVMLWLVVLLAQLPGVGSVFVHGHGNMPGCTGTSSYLLMVGVKDNAAALAAASGTIVVVTKFQPMRVLRALPWAALDTIKALVNKPSGPYDTTKMTAEIFEAVSHGKVAPDEAQELPIYECDHEYRGVAHG